MARGVEVVKFDENPTLGLLLELGAWALCLPQQGLDRQLCEKREVKRRHYPALEIVTAPDQAITAFQCFPNSRLRLSKRMKVERPTFTVSISPALINS